MKAFFLVRYILLCVVGVLTFSMLFGETLEFFVRPSNLRTLFQIFVALVLLELVLYYFPLWRLKKGNGLRLIFAVVVLASLLAIFLVDLNRFFDRDQPRAKAGRVGWSNLTDLEFLMETTTHNRYYPDERFLEQVRRIVPTQDGVLYVGSLRGDPISYALYPRRVYMLMGIQQGTMDMVGIKWEDIDDPMYPDGYGNYLLEVPELTDEFREKLLELVEENDIGWLLTWDMLVPEKGRLWRIDR